MKMLTKERCSEALTRLLRPYFASVEIQNAYHDINKGYSIDHDSNVFTLLIKEHFNPQPYKFEDLHKGMWVWDDKELCCFKCNPAISTDMAQCVTYNSFWYNSGEDEDEFFEEYDEFEEGRFFPLTKALEYRK